MRNIILIFSLFFSTSIFAQGKFDVQGDLAPTGQYGIVKAKNLRGGYYGSVYDTVARNLIPVNFRDSNMLVYTRYDTTMWMLKGGLTNANWSVFSTGGNAGAYDSLLKLNNTWLGVNKFNRQIEVDSLKGAGTLYITGNLENSADIKAGRRLQAGKSLVGNGIFRFYNYNHNYRTDLQGDSMLTSNVDLLLPSSSGKLALTTDIAPVDTSIISTKAYVNYKDDIQQGFIDMRKLDADSIAWTGYATRARLQQQLDSSKTAQAVVNGVQNDTLNSHNTRILAAVNAGNTNAANINLKVNKSGDVITGRFTTQSLVLNKDSIPITSTNRWLLAIDTTTGRVQRIWYFTALPDTTISSNYTLTSRDIGRSIYCTNTSLITITIPTGLTTGLINLQDRRCNIGVYQEGTGNGLVQFAASGTTLQSTEGATKTRVANSYAEIKFKSDTVIKLVGDII